MSLVRAATRGTGFAERREQVAVDERSIVVDMPAAASFLRFLADAARYVRRPLTEPEARTIVARRIEQRDSAFVRTMKEAVFSNPGSPYRALFKAARCELGDLEREVHDNGVEATLEKLLASGVGLSFEEFKGRRPIERDGLTLAPAATDFDMPLAIRGYRTTSGGSSGRGTPLSVSIATIAADAPVRLIGDTIFGITRLPMIQWWEILPSPTGVNSFLRKTNGRYALERWFYPRIDRGGTGNLRARAATEAIVAAARFAGVKVPHPEPLGLDEAATVVRWADAKQRSGARCAISTNVSRAVRVASAARDAGVDLSGTAFVDLGGEPVTRGKAEAIRSSGASMFTTYYIGEAGNVGVGCADPDGFNDVHFCSDRFALLTRPRDLGDESVDEIYLTTLDGTSPKVMINVATDDFATVDERACGCGLDAIGLRTHIRDIFSISKLTGEGVTLVGSDMVRILEQVLPARFGGSPVDYQLVEIEEGVMTRLELVVDPVVPIEDEAELVSVMLEALGTGGLATDIRGIWSQAGTVQVRRARPTVTSRGKLIPIRSERRPTREE